MGSSKSQRSKKRKFSGNRYTLNRTTDTLDRKEGKTEPDLPTASTSKLDSSGVLVDFSAIQEDGKLTGNRIMDIEILITVFSVLCCPVCLNADLYLSECSRFGLCSNFDLKCKHCSFTKAFASTPKVENLNIINTLLVLGLRLIGKGYSSGKKLFSMLNLPYISKSSFRRLEKKILQHVSHAAEENMYEAAAEVQSKKNSSNCGVSVDGTWQRRGYSSLNGCVAALSIDTGKVMDIDVMSQYCRVCGGASQKDHVCKNHSGSSGSMEVVGAYRIFERSEKCRNLRYVEYYGDGDSKAYSSVKHLYGRDSVVKLECIGHIQKRVGSRLRKLKKEKKGLGGKGKLTDNFIDKLQNYYGIAIRSHKGDVRQLQSSVIAAFFHCCSSSGNELHGQCPPGNDSWCKYQEAKSKNVPYKTKSTGLSPAIMKIVKPVYMELCSEKLLGKCLHGKTQNANESFNGVVWKLLPKDVFVEIQTLRLGMYMAVLLFNAGSLSLLSILRAIGVPVGHYILCGLKCFDDMRIIRSQRQSLKTVKSKRKILRARRKKKIVSHEEKEGVMYKGGEF